MAHHMPTFDKEEKHQGIDGMHPEYYKAFYQVKHLLFL